MNTIIVTGGVIVCVLALVAYVIISVFQSEWIGVSGKNTKPNPEPTNPPKKAERPKDFFSS